MEETGAHPEFDRRRRRLSESASGQLVKLCSEVATDGEGHMAGAQLTRGNGLAPTRHAQAKMPNPLERVTFVAFQRERGICARTPTFTNRHTMSEATPRQKRTVAALIAKTAQPVTFDEASRLIRELRREQQSFPALVEKIIAADRAGDAERLGRLLSEAKRHMAHGAWLPLLRELGINPRRAQRLMARV